MIDADTLFHTFVTEISGNPVIVEMMVPHYSNMERVMAEVLRESTAMPEIVWKEHAGILDAIIRGDSRRAEGHAREHVENAAIRVLASLEARQKEADDHALSRLIQRH